MIDSIHRPLIILDMDDVVAVHRQFTSYQVKMAFQNRDLEYPELWGNLILGEARENLRLLHEEFFPQYVSSTSWSTFLSRKEMEEVFRRTNMSFVADNLHQQWTTPKRSLSSRLTEISDWLRLYRKEDQPVLVLDDHLSGSDLRDSQLDKDQLIVLCDPWIGFVRDKYLTSKDILHAQLHSNPS